MLTNHFFLELINNGGRRDILVANEKDITQKIPGCMLENAGMENIEAGFFPCDSFTELRPTGTKPLSEIREVLREQLYRCMCQLELLQHGKGADYPLNMNENGSDKAHACQYISFLALHAKRHAEQLEKYAPCRSETGHDSVCV